MPFIPLAEVMSPPRLPAASRRGFIPLQDIEEPDSATDAETAAGSAEATTASAGRAAAKFCYKLQQSPHSRLRSQFHENPNLRRHGVDRIPGGPRARLRAGR